MARLDSTKIYGNLQVTRKVIAKDIEITGSFNAPLAARFGTGTNSVVEGTDTTATAPNAHAEGEGSSATGDNSHAGGQGTIAQGKNQTVIGKFNEPQGSPSSTNPDDHAFIVGNGTSNSDRSNAMSVSWKGDGKFQGDVEDGEGNILRITNRKADELKSFSEVTKAFLEPFKWEVNNYLPVEGFYRVSNIIHTGDMFIALTDTHALYSTDGKTWEANQLPKISPWDAIAYDGEGLFVAIDSQNTNQIMTSGDGIVWTVQQLSITESRFTGICSGNNGTFVILAHPVGTNHGFSLTSTNGIDWVQTQSGLQGLFKVIYGNNLFIAIGENIIARSSDGMEWQTIPMEGVVYESAIVFEEGRFVIVTQNNTHISTDGVDWDTHPINLQGNNPHITEMIYNGTIYIGVDGSGYQVSVDAVNWHRSQIKGYDTNISRIGYGGNKFIILKKTSTDRSIAICDLTPKGGGGDIGSIGPYRFTYNELLGTLEIGVE